MTTTLERIFRDGLRASDYSAIKPNTLLVSPVRPPDRISGLVMPGSSVTGANAILYRVEAVSPLARGAESGRASVWLLPGDAGDTAIATLKPGDVVTLRNGMLEPVHPDGSLLAIDVRHVLGVVQVES